MTEHARSTPTGEGTSSTDRCETGIFLSGIQQFREIFDMRKTTDPFVVAGRPMQEIGSYGAINKVHVADKAVDKKERYKARAIIIYFNTLFHKRQAAIKLKKFLQRNPKLKATVSDVFPSTETPRALALTRYAADKIYHKSMTRTRVINKSGTAILQHTEGESKQFKDSVVTEADLDPYYQPRESGERERKTDRKMRNRDEKELRDQDRAACRANNSCDQSSFNYNQGQTQQQLPQRTGKQQQTQTHRHTGTQAHRHTGTQAHRHTGTQPHSHTDTQTHRHTDTQTHRHTYTCTNTHTHIHTYTHTHMFLRVFCYKPIG
jgi:hypothetical protein